MSEAKALAPLTVWLAKAVEEYGSQIRLRVMAEAVGSPPVSIQFPRSVRPGERVRLRFGDGLAIDPDARVPVMLREFAYTGLPGLKSSPL
jgi:hypothetical protein